MDRPRSPTILDVAEASGVSYSTVSRVLNGFEFVKADTRTRVLKSADDLGYVANVQARSLAGGKSKIIGVLVPSLDNSYISAVCQGIDKALTKSGYNLMLYTTHRQAGKEARYTRAIAGGLTDGLLLMVPLLPQGELESSYLNVLREQRFPYVLIDQTDGVNKSASVDSSNYRGALEATTYLLKLGHRRIGFVTGHRAINASEERLRGYKAALETSKTAVEPLIVEGDFDYAAGYSAAKSLLEQAPKPTAIFASNDLSAFGVMDALRDKNLRIPEDVSVIGFDDIPQASVSYPKLTTVRQPLEQMGRVAVELLLAQLTRPNAPARQVTLDTVLVKRGSCSAV